MWVWDRRFWVIYPSPEDLAEGSTVSVILQFKDAYRNALDHAHFLASCVSSGSNHPKVKHEGESMRSPVQLWLANATRTGRRGLSPPVEVSAWHVTFVWPRLSPAAASPTKAGKEGKRKQSYAARYAQPRIDGHKTQARGTQQRASRGLRLLAGGSGKHSQASVLSSFPLVSHRLRVL